MNLFTLLFRRQAGEQNESDVQRLFSDSLLNENVALRWSNAVYTGHFKQAKIEKDKVSVKREALPFEVLFDDRDFLIIKEHYGVFEEIINKINESGTISSFV